MTDTAYCAHLNVLYKPLELGRGRFRDRWTCRDCDHPFVPTNVTTPAEPAQETARPLDTSVALSVGDPGENLYVYGSVEATKRVQDKLFAADSRPAAPPADCAVPLPEIPLCANHAEWWFCERNHLPNPDAPCVICAFGAASSPLSPQPEKRVRELLSEVHDALVSPTAMSKWAERAPSWVNEVEDAFKPAPASTPEQPPAPLCAKCPSPIYQDEAGKWRHIVQLPDFHEATLSAPSAPPRPFGFRQQFLEIRHTRWGKMAFSVNCSIADLTYEEMCEFRVMACVGIAQAESIWKRANEAKQQSQSKAATPSSTEQEST